MTEQHDLVARLRSVLTDAGDGIVYQGNTPNVLATERLIARCFVALSLAADRIEALESRQRELEAEGLELANHLDKTVAVAADAVGRAKSLEIENTELRELRRVSFIEMLAILRENGDRLEVHNSSFTGIDPYSDEIIQTANDARYSIIFERRARRALAGDAP